MPLSGIAMENLMQSVPDLNVSLTNGIGSQHTIPSGLRTNGLKTIDPKANAFPAQHEV